MEEGRNAFKILTFKPTGKILLGRSNYTLEDDVRMNIREIGVNMRNLVDLFQDRDYWRALVNMLWNLWVP